MLSTTLLVHLGREPKDLTEGVKNEEIRYSSRNSRKIKRRGCAQERFPSPWSSKWWSNNNNNIGIFFPNAQLFSQTFGSSEWVDHAQCSAWGRDSVLCASSWLLPCFRAYSIFTSTPVSGHGTAASLIQSMRSIDAVSRDLGMGLQMEVPPSMAKSKEAQHDRLYVEGHDLCICGGSTVSDRMGQVGRYRVSEPSPVRLFYSYDLRWLRQQILQGCTYYVRYVVLR